jgi:DNA invertase Pin-like site-specific DNA recombinase
MKAAIYARVSTTGNGQSPEKQIREFSEHCQRRGWTIADKYVDIGVSGAKEKRPELDRLMADAHRRRFDVVVVWKFDRFARSVSHLLRALETFNALGIAFVSLSEQMDTTTPAGKMVQIWVSHKLPKATVWLILTQLPCPCSSALAIPNSPQTRSAWGS